MKPKSKILIYLAVFFVVLLMTSTASSQMKYNIKLNLNGKQLFSGCCKDAQITFVYIPLEELAKAIDPAVNIAGPFEIGPYFKIEGTKLNAIKTGSGTNAKLKINKTGLISTGVKEIVFEDGKKHAFIEIESFVAALGGSWSYNESTGVYSVTAGGCGACFINEQ
jgi:hypothetical protein